MSKNKPDIISTKGPKHGICNICGASGKLTEDHTPPKGSIKISQVELYHIINHLNNVNKKPIEKGRYLQNGVKYRTLCGACNNTHLGAQYDPAFNLFVNTVGAFLKTNILLPKVIPIEIEPQKIMRSLIGHLSAQGVNRFDKGPDTIPIRDFFLNISLPLPDNIHIYYWLYPHKSHVMARDFSYLDTRDGKSCVMWLLKFFPIAFMVAFDKPDEWVFGLSELSRWRYQAVDYKIREYVQLTNLPHLMWPEAPIDHNVVCYGKEAIVSYNYKEK
jgi:hypothetical protein